MKGFFGQNLSFQKNLPQIGEFLLKCLSNESVTVVLESLNSIFDIYAEESQVFKSLNMLNALGQTFQRLNKIKENKEKEMNDQSDVDEEEEEMILEEIDESLLNLKNFIDYKKKN